jgi:hypothetical protein
MSVYRVQPAKSSELSFPKARPTLDENFLQAKVVDPSMNFTRSSGGTYVGSDGLIKIAGVNQPRFDHDPLTGECRGLLVEESRTNFCTYSNNFTGADWSTAGSGATPTITSNATISPDGTNNASLYVAPVSGTFYYWRNNAATIGTAVRTFSIFCKAAETGFVSIRCFSGQQPFDASATFNLYNGTVVTNGPMTASVIPYPNGWYRCIMTRTDGNDKQPYNFQTTGYASFYIYGAQLDGGTFLTSYIPTTTTALTRAADKPIINRSINSSGTFYVEANTPTTSGVVMSADNSSTSLTIRPTLTGSNRYSLYYNPSKYAQISSSTSVVSTEYSRVLPPFTPSNINRISLGYDEFGGGTSYINGHIRRFTYYSAPVSENIVKSIVGNNTQIFRENTGIVTNGLVLNLDAGNKLSLPLDGYNDGRNWSSGWSGNFGTAANSFDGNLSTYSGNVGGTFLSNYNFSPPLTVNGTVRVYAMFGSTSGQVAGRTGVILINGNDISAKVAAANAYLTGAWIDVTQEVGSIFNSIVLNGTSGSTNPGIAAIEVNGQILLNTTVSPTTWLDLSGNGRNGTMTNGPTYNNANGGSIVFDGVDDFINGNITPLTGNYSVEIIFKLISFPAADSSLLAFSGPDGHGFLAEIRSSDKKIRFLHRFPYGVSGGDSYYSNGTVDLNQIYCITWVRDSNLKLYINSVFDSQLTGTTSFFDSNLTAMSIGRLLPNSADRHTNGNIYSVKTYNRALSQQEITQNFNAQRQRYGI